MTTATDGMPAFWKSLYGLLIQIQHLTSVLASPLHYYYHCVNCITKYEITGSFLSLSDIIRFSHTLYLVFYLENIDFYDKKKSSKTTKIGRLQELSEFDGILDNLKPTIITA